jgi:hypothetical protein
MKSLLSAKPLIVATLAVGAFAAASAAHARTDVVLSIGVPAPYGYVQPAPVYVQPRPVYVQPQPVHVQPRPVYVQPQPVYYGSYRTSHRQGAWGDADRDGVPNVYDRDSRFYDARAAHRNGNWGDADRDGVPNRYDHAPANPYRR